MDEKWTQVEVVNNYKILAQTSTGLVLKNLRDMVSTK